MKKVISIFFVVVMIAMTASCTGKTPQATEVTSQVTEVPTEAEQVQVTAEPISTQATEYVAPSFEIPDEFLTVNGQIAARDTDVVLSAEETAKIKAGNFKIGIALHYAGNDWSTALVAGIQDVCKELNVVIVGITDANFDPTKQVSDLENLMALSPDAIIMVPANPDAVAAQQKAITAAGIKLVISEAISNNLTPDDYVTFVSADAYGNGVASGMAMAEALKGVGKVAVIHWSNPSTGMVYRHQGFIDYLTAEVPGIEIVDIIEFNDPNKVSEVSDAVFLQHPDLNGAWASWDVPAEQVASSAKFAGKDDSFAITTIDLGLNVAKSIASNGMFKGVGAQRPYFAGKVEALAALKAIIGSDVPKYIKLASLMVTKNNLLEAFPLVFNTEAPQEIKDLMKQ